MDGFECLEFLGESDADGVTIDRDVSGLRVAVACRSRKWKILLFPKGKNLIFDS